MTKFIKPPWRSSTNRKEITLQISRSRNSLIKLPHTFIGSLDRLSKPLYQSCCRLIPCLSSVRLRPSKKRLVLENCLRLGSDAGFLGTYFSRTALVPVREKYYPEKIRTVKINGRKNLRLLLSSTGKRPVLDTNNLKVSMSVVLGVDF